MWEVINLPTGTEVVFALRCLQGVYGGVLSAPSCLHVSMLHVGAVCRVSIC